MSDSEPAREPLFGYFGDFDESMDQVERLMKRTQKAAKEMNDITGEGEAASGMIRAVVGANGRIKELTFNPRVRRLDRETLAEEVIKAVTAAQDDVERRSRELMTEALGPLGDGLSSREDFGLEKLIGQMNQVEEYFSHSMQQHMQDLEKIRRRFE